MERRKTRDERKATFSGNTRHEMSMKPLSPEMTLVLSCSQDKRFSCRALKTRDEHEATFSGDELRATVSPSRYLKTRDEHEATFSGDEHKAAFSLSCSKDKR